MAYKLYMAGTLMPITPSKVTVKINNQNKTMTLIIDRSDRNLLGLGRTTAPLELRLFSRRGQPARLLDDGGRVHVADDADDEVRGVIERIVAEFQSIGRDVLDALNCARDVIAHGVVLVHDAEQVFHHGGVRAVLIHFDQLQPATIIVDEPELGLHPYAIN